MELDTGRHRSGQGRLINCGINRALTEITLMNSIHVCSFMVSWSHGPAGAVGNVNTVSSCSLVISRRYREALRVTWR